MAAAPDVPVLVVDRVTLPRSEAATWVERMHREYRPLAESRGYVLGGVWQTRATAPHAVEIVIEWRLPGVREFFRSRAGSTHPAILRWWADTDAVALGRTRAVMGPQP